MRLFQLLMWVGLVRLTVIGQTRNNIMTETNELMRERISIMRDDQLIMRDVKIQMEAIGLFIRNIEDYGFPTN